MLYRRYSVHCTASLTAVLPTANFKEFSVFRCSRFCQPRYFFYAPAVFSMCGKVVGFHICFNGARTVEHSAVIWQEMNPEGMSEDLLGRTGNYASGQTKGGKGQLYIYPGHKYMWNSGGIAPCILKFCSRLRRLIVLTSQVALPRE